MEYTDLNVKTPSGISALFEAIQKVKFSTHTPLFVVLCSIIYTVYRSDSYFREVFKLPPIVALSGAIFSELTVIGSSAALFIALREQYISELRELDKARSPRGVYLSVAALVFSFVALLGIAIADGFHVTKEVLPTLIMALVQIVQMLLMMNFIVSADLHERDNLRVIFKKAKAALEAERMAQAIADQKLLEKQMRRAQRVVVKIPCQWCERPIGANNKKKHALACPKRPALS